VRLDIRKIATLKEAGEVIGSRTRVRVVKNKLAPPFKEAEFDIVYGIGINRLGEIIDLGANSGLVEKSGTWFSFGERRLGQGRNNAMKFLTDNPEMTDELNLLIRERLGLGNGKKDLEKEAEEKK
jgi:recombination protein RecA